MVTKDNRSDVVAASELARLGFCERRIRLQAQYGERVTTHQAAARAAGTVEHGRFLRESLLVESENNRTEAKRWCFVATSVFGEHALETRTLRRFRERVLRKHAAGRWAISVYYRFSPALCAHVSRSSRASALMRWLLRLVAALAARHPSME